LRRRASRFKLILTSDDTRQRLYGRRCGAFLQRVSTWGEAQSWRCWTDGLLAGAFSSSDALVTSEADLADETPYLAKRAFASSPRFSSFTPSVPQEAAEAVSCRFRVTPLPTLDYPSADFAS
jgi:hypothetical protein